MNRIVLIGNGFDLAHDLKTSYKDFIYGYWQYRFSKFANTESSKSVDALCVFERLDKNPWYLFRLDVLRNPLNKISGKQAIDIIINDRNKYKVTFSPLFERIYNSIETKGWVDIENEYYNLLTEYAFEESAKEKLARLNGQLLVLKDLLIEYLNSIEKQTTAFDCIKDKIYAPINSREISVAASNFCSGTDSIDRIMLLSFNYTNTAEKYCENDGNINCTVNYIHGKVDNPQSVIFGYGDELDAKFKELQNLGNNECLKNVKSIRYLERDNYRNVLAFMESAPYQVYIMGHSCGNSDRTLLNTLFEHKNCVSIKPYYYRKEDGFDNYIELVQNISRNFTDMKLMRDRVVNKEYCEMLTG